LFDQHPQGDGVPSPRTLNHLAFACALLENLFRHSALQLHDLIGCKLVQKVPDPLG
jgi:hypothetical protein